MNIKSIKQNIKRRFLLKNIQYNGTCIKPIMNTDEVNSVLFLNKNSTKTHPEYETK